nr:unnamed protein product [Callosobruchus analis]
MLARKKVADVRQKILKTGGGPPPKDDEDELVLSTMNLLTFKGLNNSFDSDSVTTININQTDQFEYVAELEKSENKNDEIVGHVESLENYGSKENFLETTVLEAVMQVNIEENEVNIFGL